MKNKSKLFKIFKIIVIVIIFVGIVLYALSEIWLEPYIKKQIRATVQKVGNVEYKVNFEDMDLQIFGTSLYFEKLEIIPVKKPSKIIEDNYKLLLDNLAIEGFDMFTYLFDKAYEIDEIKIANTNINIFKYVNAEKKETSTNDSTSNQQVNVVKIDKFSIKKGTFTIYNVDDNNSNPLFQTNIDIEVKNIKYENSTDWTEKLNYNKLFGQFTNVVTKTTDSLRRFEIKNVLITGDQDQHHAEITEFQLNTRTKKYKLAEIVGHESDWVKLNIPSIQIKSWQAKPLLLKLNFNSTTIDINQPDLFVFRDKRAPDNTKKTFVLPYDFLADLKTQISIDTINVQGASITYQEHVQAMDEPGNIKFSEFYASLHNFTNNDATKERKGNKAFMFVNTKLMGAAPLKAKFTFNLEKNATNAVEGSMGETDLTIFNPMISKVGYVKIKSGNCYSLDFNYTYNAQSAHGDVLFKYDNLEVETISQNDGDKDSFGQNIKTFLADFIVDDDNMGGDTHNGEISFARNPQKSVINYWWKSLLTGLRKSVGMPGEVKK